MLILGIHSGPHDSAACVFDDYRILAAVPQERLTRVKGDGGRMPVEAIDECLALAGCGRREVDAVALGRSLFSERYYRHPRLARATTRRLRRLLGREKQRYMLGECRRYGTTETHDLFDAPAFLRDHGFRSDAQVAFSNHHAAHALPCLFHTDWPEALLYTADGRGDNAQYSIRLFGAKGLETLYGGEEEVLKEPRVDGVGEVYSIATEVLGFLRNRHEGKLNGLAAYGRPVFFEALKAHFRVDAEGQIHSDFESYAAMEDRVRRLARDQAPEDVAASAQQLLETLILEAIGRILARHPRRFLGLSGGVFANVRLNQRLAEELPVEEIFVFPAMSDQGQPYGAVLDFLLQRDGLERWLQARHRLETLYFGRDYGIAADEHFERDPRFSRVSARSVPAAAELLHRGRVVAIYNGGMEYGPRALGARSILAAPLDRGINQTLNDRLGRNEFMPFAPVVAAEDADAVFELGPRKRYSARFMTVTCRVRDPWRERIPAVVHIDGTARPQVIERSQSPFYYDVLAAYKAISGIPVLVNTSFNIHEEPIINSPAECARALAGGKIDFVATDRGVYGMA